jgi:hypothetical protein
MWDRPPGLSFLRQPASVSAARDVPKGIDSRSCERASNRAKPSQPELAFKVSVCQRIYVHRSIQVSAQGDATRVLRGILFPSETGGEYAGTAVCVRAAARPLGLRWRAILEDRHLNSFPRALISIAPTVLVLLDISVHLLKAFAESDEIDLIKFVPSISRFFYCKNDWNSSAN